MNIRQQRMVWNRIAEPEVLINFALLEMDIVDTNNDHSQIGDRLNDDFPVESRCCQSRSWIIWNVNDIELVLDRVLKSCTNVQVDVHLLTINVVQCYDTTASSYY